MPEETKEFSRDDVMALVADVRTEAEYGAQSMDARLAQSSRSTLALIVAVDFLLGNNERSDAEAASLDNPIGDRVTALEDKVMAFPDVGDLQDRIARLETGNLETRIKALEDGAFNNASNTPLPDGVTNADRDISDRLSGAKSAFPPAPEPEPAPVGNPPETADEQTAPLPASDVLTPDLGSEAP